MSSRRLRRQVLVVAALGSLITCGSAEASTARHGATENDRRPPTSGPPPDRQEAFLELYINDTPRESIFAILAGDDVWIEPAALESAGIRDVGGRRERARNRDFVALKSLAPALSFRLDRTACRLASSPRVSMNIATRQEPCERHRC